MTNAKKDNNQIPVLLLISNADGTTTLQLKANPTTHALIVDNGTTGSDLSGDTASRDDNGQPVAIAVSNSDGSTPVSLYADSSTGRFLIKST